MQIGIMIIKLKLLLKIESEYIFPVLGIEHNL